jgi:adenylate cyclase
MSDDPARILVVDDVPENVRLLEAVLEAHRYDVVSATNGQAALELARSASPDLVLLDVMMPPPDGLAVCRRLRQQEETAVLPVIMLTASEGSEKSTAIEAGADDFIPSRSTARSFSPGSGRCCGSSAITTRSRPKPQSSWI